MGHQPQWSNVYNKVSVTICNHEFGEVSTKEVEAANYLDMVHGIRVTNHHHINEHLSMEHIIEKGNIGVESSYNNQSAGTKMFINEQQEHLRLV